MDDEFERWAKFTIYRLQKQADAYAKTSPYVGQGVAMIDGKRFGIELALHKYKKLKRVK